MGRASLQDRVPLESGQTRIRTRHAAIPSDQALQSL